MPGGEKRERDRNTRVPTGQDPEMPGDRPNRGDTMDGGRDRIPKEETGDQPSMLDNITTALYGQLLSLMGTQVDSADTSRQVGELSSILSQRSALQGKDLAAGRWRRGGATATDISGILRGEQQALSRGVTDILTAEQDRVDRVRSSAISQLLQMRGQLSVEQQQEIDNALNQAMFDWQRYVDQKEIDLTEAEQEQAFWSFVGDALFTVAGGAVGFAVGGPAGVIPGATAGSQVID